MLDLAAPVVRPERTLVPTLMILVVLLPLTAVISRRWGGRTWAAMGAVTSALLIADATVFRPGLLHARSDWGAVTRACQVTDPDQWGIESLLNVGLFVPFAFFAVLAVGRHRTAVTSLLSVPVVILLSGCFSLGIEVTQAAYSIGVCDSSDVVHNVVGAGLGAVLGALLAAGLSAVGPARPAMRRSVDRTAGETAGLGHR